MGATLAHRGPDDAGTWCDPAAGVALAHRRLAILDLTSEGHQPMVARDGKRVLVYNGEVYNFAELRAELEARGARFRGRSDTEVLLESLALHGVERTLGRLVGMFAFALWDGEARELVLARDRLGIKPLYWGTGAGGGGDGATLFFASELKALRAHPGFEARLDRDALTLYLRHNYVPAPRSIYVGVQKLPPGCWARVRAPGSVELRTYWDARDVARRGLADPRALGYEEAVLELERVLRTAVRDRLVADVPVGAFLSGGIDSSTVVALMQQETGRPVRTFTIGFNEEGFDEAAHGARVARHLGTDHTELYVTSDEARAVVPSIPEHWDEPFSDSSQIPTFLVSRLARQHVTVSLSGDGGDELFGGYPRYYLARRLRRALRFVPRGTRRALAAALGAIAPASWDRLSRTGGRLVPLGAQVGWVGQRAARLSELLGTLEDGGLYRSLVSHWKEPAALVPGSAEPATALSDPAYDEEFTDELDRMMLLDTKTYLPDDILCKVDRASMAVGLEARVPLLDHRVVELAWSLPQDVRVGPAPGKRLLRGLLARHVPRELFERPKMGFGIPISEWLRGPLRAWGEELLDPRRLTREDNLRPEPIRARWEEHLAGRRDWGYYLWDVLVFQAWHARWMGGG